MKALQKVINNPLYFILLLLFMLQVQQASAQCTECNSVTDPTNCGVVGDDCDYSCPGCPDPPELPVDQGVYFVLIGGLLLAGYVVYRKHQTTTA